MDGKAELKPDLGRGGQLIVNPTRELQLQAGDVLIVSGEASDLNPLNRE